ncbi:multipass membrane protein [Candidatus Mancarchaeum acidiphilum]|uniref:Multipass membrane protein n=1 Tax=Candidatus Mancarchaeum acidiphilum TaxID=1920749 RepID=A0A218NM86_9ARCH|nr:hypothetical protein [Candidatus Mancarchaeum acidiphilum]ASI13585.1 multipass membrane protein [Candidatus Mancarchaeum acidiphilum]
MKYKFYTMLSALNSISIVLNYRYLYISAPILLANILVLAKPRLGNRNLKQQSEEFLINLASQQNSNDKQILNKVLKSINKEFKFGKDITRALRYYHFSGSLEYLSNLKYNESKLLERIKEIIVYSIHSGTDIYKPILTLKSEYYKSDVISRRSRALVKSSEAIMIMGNLVFIPMFAGISANILKFTSTISSGAILEFLTIIIFYLLMVNWINAEYSNKRDYPVLYLSIFYTAVASFALFSTYNVASRML